jgi:glycosyltransferase involved in cell wall biosynthesis
MVGNGNDESEVRKIAYILTPVDFGGAEQVSLSFLRQYKQQDIRIYPILLCRPWEMENHFRQELQRDGIAYAVVPTRIRPREEGGDYFRLIRCGVSLYGLLKKGRYDLVHTNGYFADIIGLIVAKLLGVPIVTTCHGFISNTLKFRFYNFLDINALKFMNEIITVSEKLENELIAGGIVKDKINIVQNAVLLADDYGWKKRQRRLIREQYGIQDNEFLFGYVGRLSVEKGIEYLMKAGVMLLEKDIPLRILVIGDGPQADEIYEFVRENALEDTVIFAGFQKNVVDILPAFDVFVLPSLTEGTSMALLEAMACGLPIIATAVGGTPKVVDSHKNGLLVPPASPQAIVDAAQQLYADTGFRKKIGDAALRTIESDFSITRWLEKINSIYVGAFIEKA